MELIAVYGAVLSTILLGYELYKFFHLERPRLKVKISLAVVAGPNGPSRVLSASAINIGRRPITLHACGIGFDNVMRVTWLRPQDGFPKQLEEGQSMTTYRELQKVKESIKEAGGKPIYFWYRDAMEKNHKTDSKYTKRLLAQISEGEFDDENSEAN